MAKQKKLTREQVLQLMKFYEQKYFTHDLPVPFKKHLSIYPAIVREYYDFYFNILCFKMNKNEDPEGVTMSHLGYLLHKVDDKENGGQVYNQLINLLEMIFHIKNGLKCPKCGDLITFEEINKEIEKINTISDKTTRELFLKKYLEDVTLCDKCTEISPEKNGEVSSEVSEENMRLETFDEKKEKYPVRYQVIDYSNKQGSIKLSVDGVDINSNDYDLLRNIVLYYNIPDYDDEYINPELKAELEEVARLKNPNNVQPSLEKQESCIVSTGVYTYETIKDITIRKMVILLRTIDARLLYFAYRQAECGGFVKFKQELVHWIWGNDNKNKFSDIMTMDSLKDKLKDVT